MSAPALPHADAPEWKSGRDFLLANYAFDNETVLIGHSSGATQILSVLEALEQPIAKAILVSGFYKVLDEGDISQLMLPEQFDRAKIRNHCKEIILINSDNDPWGCDDAQARPVAEKLGAQFILAQGMGHMGSGTFNDPCLSLPLLLGYC